MNTPSSKALINQNHKISSWRIFFLSIATAFFLILLWRIGDFKEDPFINETLSIQGEALSGSKLFKINCVGCHGISAQGFVGPDLHEATQEILLSKKWVKKSSTLICECSSKSLPRIHNGWELNKVKTYGNTSILFLTPNQALNCFDDTDSMH